MASGEKKPPAIVYVPGLSGSATNTGHRVADVLARSLDNQSEGLSYSTTSDTMVTAPRGLKVSKTIVSSDDSRTFQVFELDYKPRFERRGTAGNTLRSNALGALEASKYLALGWFKVVAATVRFRRRSSKSVKAKLQLAIGYVLVLPLLLAWLIAVYGLYKAFVPAGSEWLERLLGDSADDWSLALGVGGAAGIVSWQLLRTRLLGLATITQQLIDYTLNRDRGRDTTCMALDDAIAGLLDNDYGEIHLLGYSMGSLVMFDTVFAQQSSLTNEAPIKRITSMTTIGCPLDLVRMFYPKYLEGRVGRIASSEVTWVNIFNAADVFGSNLSDGTDDVPRPASRETRHDLVERAPQEVTAADVPGLLNAESVRYLNEDLTLWQMISRAKGFRVHSQYWGEADEAHCFEPFVQILRASGTQGISARTVIGTPEPPELHPSRAPRPSSTQVPRLLPQVLARLWLALVAPLRRAR